MEPCCSRSAARAFRRQAYTAANTLRLLFLKNSNLARFIEAGHNRDRQQRRNHTEEDLNTTVMERAEVVSGAFPVVCASLPQTVIS